MFYLGYCKMSALRHSASYRRLFFKSVNNIGVEDRAILSHDNKGRMNTCLSISQVETRYERSTFIISEMIGGLYMFALVLSLFLVRKIILSTDYNPREILKQMRIKNATKIIISHLSINSIRNTLCGYFTYFRIKTW